jgi:mono/diheme cytochrome c family protein
MNSRLTAIIVLLFGCAILAGQSSPQVKKTNVKDTSPASGKEMFVQYCASCHGKDGKGAGPAAPALKIPPTNLTTLASRNNGTFPEVRVARIIEGSDELAAHGSMDMPIWGQVFHQMDGSALMKLRVANLSAYLKTLQVK